MTSPLATDDDLTAEARPYTPFGAAHALWRCRAQEAMISGAAGTGKSRAILEKLHWCATKYAWMRGLIFRKRRKDLTESGLVTFEEKVLPAGHTSLGKIRREGRHSYRYKNGSVVVVGGLDDPSKVMSTEYDLAVGLECRELEEADWESVSARCRNGVMPYQQVVGDTNPDAPGHWIKRRAAAGKLELLESRHEDNPALWDRDRQEWTEAGRQYMTRLDELTGLRYQRLRKGLWVQAEGLVYEEWDPRVHVVDPFVVPPSWKRYWSIDFGHTNPFVCQWWAEDGDGRLYLYRELYHTKRIVEDHARQIKALSAGEPRPCAVICDHDREDRETFTRHLGLPTVTARKEIIPGIQAVEKRLRRAGDGRPRLVVVRDCLVERDPDLVETKRPTCLAEEMEGYAWKKGTGKPKEEPEDKDNHAEDACRYVVAHLDLVVRHDYHKARTPARTVADRAPKGVYG